MITFLSTGRGHRRCRFYSPTPTNSAKSIRLNGWSESYFCHWIHPQGNYRLARASGPLLCGVFGHLSGHSAGQPGLDNLDQNWCLTPHAHVLFPQSLGLCWSSLLLCSHTKDDGELCCGHNTIAFCACAMQQGCFLTFMITECFLLASVAYDCYVATCSPLHYSTLEYSTLTSKRVCIWLVAVPYVYSFLVALFHIVITFHLTYCDPSVINHFYCDDLPLLALPWSDTHMKEILIFAFAGFDMICSSSAALTSYLFIINAIVRICSTQGQRKAISTHGSHMVAVTIFYGTLIFMYLQPKSNYSLDTDKMASVFYTVVIPMLNPLIYSLRNKEVKDASKKVLGKGCETLKILKLRQ